MFAIRRSDERGHVDHGWLDTRHTFSFAEYHDDNFMGFGPLRVINEDRIAGGGGFPTHPHRDMEIITYILEGALAHKDSLGTGSVIRPGEVQKMSAGTGIRHSEFDASESEPVHLLQIWILPEARGIAPGYEQKAFDAAALRGRARLVGSPDGRDGSVTIRQDVKLYATKLESGERLDFDTTPERIGWVQIARGSMTVGGHALKQGDGLAFSGESRVALEGAAGAEALIFDMAR